MNFTWLSGTSGAWDNEDNWSPTGVPGASDDAVIAAPGVYLVTLGTVTVNDLTVDDSGAVLQAFGSLAVNNDLVVTAGTLLAQGGLFTTDFTNTGVVTVGGPALEILSGYDTESLNRTNVTANSITLGGTLNNAGQTLEAGAIWTVGAWSLGTIDGGTVLDLAADTTAWLSGVTLEGNVLEVSAYLTIADRLVVTGTSGTGIGSIDLSGGTMEFSGDQTFNDANINFAFRAAALTVDNALTLGPDISILGSDSIEGVLSAIEGAGSLVFQGNLLVASDSVLSIAVADLENSGTLADASPDFSHDGR